MMTQGQHPVLTVRAGHAQGSFTTDSDVIVGSDLHADMRVAHPLVARAHLVLRFEQGGWIAVDNHSASGVFVDGGRIASIDIRDGLAVNLGRPDGPRVTFEVAHHRGIIGLLPPTDRSPLPATPPVSAGPASAPRDRRRSQPRPRLRPSPRPHDPDTTA